MQILNWIPLEFKIQTMKPSSFCYIKLTIRKLARSNLERYEMRHTLIALIKDNKSLSHFAIAFHL